LAAAECPTLTNQRVPGLDALAAKLEEMNPCLSAHMVIQCRRTQLPSVHNLIEKQERGYI